MSDNLREVFDAAEGTEDRLYKAFQLVSQGEMSEATRTEVTHHLLKNLTPEEIAEIIVILSKDRDRISSVLSESTPQSPSSPQA